MQKKSKEKFHVLVKKCTSQDMITLLHRRKFARCARQYIVAYRAFAMHKASWKDGDDVDSVDELISASLIEKVVKVYKSHRNIVDQEKGYIRSIVDLMKNFCYK